MVPSHSRRPGLIIGLTLAIVACLLAGAYFFFFQSKLRNLPPLQARAVDAETALMIQSLDVSAADLKHVDSPPTLRLVTDLAKKWDLQPLILGQKNLYDLNGQADNTTGYINAVFQEK